MKATVSLRASFRYDPEELRFVKLLLVGQWLQGGTKGWMTFLTGQYNLKLDFMVMRILAKKTGCFRE